MRKIGWAICFLIGVAVMNEYALRNVDKYIDEAHNKGYLDDYFNGIVWREYVERECTVEYKNVSRGLDQYYCGRDHKDILIFKYQPPPSHEPERRGPKG